MHPVIEVKCLANIDLPGHCDRRIENAYHKLLYVMLSCRQCMVKATAVDNLVCISSTNFSILIIEIRNYYYEEILEVA